MAFKNPRRDEAHSNMGDLFFAFRKASASAFACLLAISTPVYAGDFGLRCARADVVNPAWNGPLTFAYKGEQRGVLKVGGVFGDFEIAASRAPLQIQPGEMGEAIDGVAKAHVKMPPLSDLEACIDQASGGRWDVKDDAFANARDACLQKVPSASSGVDAVAQIRIGFGGPPDDSGEDAFVVFRLLYDAPSRLPGGKMTVDALPAHCTLMK
jgi:hypothetical protein